ncbi:phage baseplate assembly protein V [Leptolyngbya sp. 7M]|uniref:phage baseplate assembly protein V n=1 Tax=Leptolyngbya sp. 7M TaxID=2812896 RepID=UPI001B8BA308|nr:phage baseplate assembly protein V [Leptolyngbya sp. 7M]QYO62084.1 phage baseplate assembly protein V [Leptolyngbya sp. 7M]
MNWFDLIRDSESHEALVGRIYGVAIGLVTNNKDPDKLGRVKVRFPWLSDKDESHWTRIAIPMAGKDRGLYFLPEVGDEVLVAFNQGNLHDPYILGALWNKTDRPPATNEDGENNIHMIKSRSGHTITLDDTSDQEKITICDKTKKNQIVIDSAKNTITIQVEQELTIEAKGNITLRTSGGDVAITCQNFSVQAQQKCQIKAAANLDLEANTGLGVKCLAGVNVNNGALEVI